MASVKIHSRQVVRKTPQLVRLAGSNSSLPPTETGVVPEKGHDLVKFLDYQQNLGAGWYNPRQQKVESASEV